MWVWLWMCIRVLCVYVRARLNVLFLFVKRVHRWTSSHRHHQFVERTNERTNWTDKKRRKQDIETTCIRIQFCLALSLPPVSGFVYIRICCCFKRRWIQFTKMPGGRRGLVAPQNTFLENIIRRSNSQRKYISDFLLHFAVFFFLHSFTFLLIPLDNALSLHVLYCMCVVRLRNCKCLDRRSKKKTKRIKGNPMNMSSKVNRQNHEPATEKKREEKLWIIKNSVKSPIELTLTATAKKSWRK